MTKIKILIAVKTYPTLSAKYEELVCTAGFREDGTWVRLYPVPFRKKPYSEQYKKYDWIEIDVVKNQSDFRPESYRPVRLDEEIKITSHLGTKNNWKERKEIVLQKVYTDLSQLKKEARDKRICTSLAVFRPSSITDFKIEKTTKEWGKEKLDRLKQLNIFQQEGKSSLEVVRKLPYKFSFVIQDSGGIGSKMMIEDWEIGQLYWKMARKYGNEEKACQKVKEKYLDDFARTKDLYLFLGTTQKHHLIARNPFVIVGTFHPKKENQLELF